MSEEACVLVTGASRGIGLEFVRQYAEAGARVIATCRDPDGAADLRAVPGRVEIGKLDVASEDDADALVEHLDGLPIDLLIGNAAVFGGPRSRLDTLDRAAWRSALEVNVIGTIHLATRLWPNVAASDRKQIVFISSRAALTRHAKPGASYVYRSSKAALNAAARCLALDLLDKGVVVTMLNPGSVRTGIGGANARMDPPESVARMREVIASMTPDHAGRFLQFDGTELPL